MSGAVTKGRVLELLQAESPLTVRQIRERLGLSPATGSNTVERLRRVDRVIRVAGWFSGRGKSRKNWVAAYEIGTSPDEPKPNWTPDYLEDEPQEMVRTPPPTAADQRRAAYALSSVFRLGQTKANGVFA